MSKKIYLLAFGFALSIVLHLYLTPKYYQMNFAGGISSESICNINETLNCDAVTASPYASFLNIPLSLWGFALNLILFILLFGYMLSDDKKTSWLNGLKVLTLLSALGSLVMLVISLSLVQAKCLFCFALHFIAFAQAYLALKLDQEPGSSVLPVDFFNFKKTSHVVYLLILAVPVVAYIGHSRMLSKYSGPRFDAQTKALVTDWQTATAQPLLSQVSGILEKNTGENNFEIVEFADFLCNHCKYASGVFKSFLNNYKASYKLLVMPLDQTCKSLEDTTGPSCLLAKSVYCAGKQDKGWPAHDWIFERQAELGRPVEEVKGRMQEMASSLNIEKESFTTCLNAEETHKAIVDSRKLAEDLQITGTPSIFVNGKQLKGGQMLQVLKRAYEIEGGKN